ncbi:MAG TPA: phage terminase large subunit, partial [Gemmatimonadales bacterium]|nr:phage terminase large subunit [Gemmatimonadales bacterium]
MTALAAPIAKIPVVIHGETGTCVYALQRKQFEVFRLTPIYWRHGTPGPRFIGCGGSAGGGKSYLTRAVATAVALKWPGSSSIIFRGTENEVEQNHVQKFLLEVPPEIDGVPLYRYNGEKMSLLWANGSRTKFGFLRTDRDVQTYLGAEYDFMDFDEATTYTEFMVSYLIGNRLRSTVPGTTPFAMFPSNPGNRGHHWYKRWFVEKRYRDYENPADYAFIQMFLRDNQELMQRDPSYARKLDLLPEPWRSWQRDGNWQAGAGTAFPELSYQKHLIKPFGIPPHWKHWGSFDWGFAHPWSYGDNYTNEDGRIFVRETLRGHRMADHAIAQAIKDWLGESHQTLQEVVAGHDCWSVE